MKILLIEDDADTAAYVADGLRERGHAVDHVADGGRGLSLAADERYELLIVDRMLPGVDGLAIVQTVRARGVRTPVLFLSTLGGLDDRVTGLDAGGDDYLVKPFAFLRAGGPRERARPPPGHGRAGDGAAGGRSRDGPAEADGDPSRPADRPAAA